MEGEIRLMFLLVAGIGVMTFVVYCLIALGKLWLRPTLRELQDREPDWPDKMAKEIIKLPPETAISLITSIVSKEHRRR